MVNRSPSTVVKAPPPLRTKRSAVRVWRWALAISPGLTSWTEVCTVLVAPVTPGTPGLRRRMVRLSDCSRLTNSPASMSPL